MISLEPRHDDDAAATQNYGEMPMNAIFIKKFASVALAVTIAVVVSLTPAAAGSGGGGHGGWGGGGSRPMPTPPSKVTGTSKPINCKACGAGCMKQK